MIKPNDTVYFFHWAIFYSGTVKSIKKFNDKKYKNKEFAVVKTMFGTFNIPIEECFLNEQDCLKNKKQKDIEEINKYLNGIKSKDDLIIFMLENQVCGENYDYNAKRAVLLKCEDFDIKIPLYLYAY